MRYRATYFQERTIMLDAIDKKDAFEQIVRASNGKATDIKIEVMKRKRIPFS